MEKLNKIKFLNALDLKIIAMILMLGDHMWATIIPGNQWLTSIGRLAFPIFAFQIAEGAVRTKDLNKYIKRMFIFALISEIPFNLMYDGGIIYPFHQNVLFTFLIALLLIKFTEYMKAKNAYFFIPATIISCFVGYALGFITMSDYFGYGVLTVLLFYFSRQFKFSWLWELLGMICIHGFMMVGIEFTVSIFGFEFLLPQQAFAVLALIPIWLYNGKSGTKNKYIQYGCYAFYPVHMLILSLIRYIIAL